MLIMNCDQTSGHIFEVCYCRNLGLGRRLTFLSLACDHRLCIYQWQPRHLETKLDVDLVPVIPVRRGITAS